MSEHGWQQFLGATGVEDWVVLHDGATAAFRVTSLVEAARLAEAVAGVPGMERGIVLTVASDRLTVRLTRVLWQLESEHIEVARAVSWVAAADGARPDRSAVQEVQVAIAAQPDSVDIGFWRALLGYEPMADDNAVDPRGHGSTMWVQELESLRHAMHLDVSVAREHVGGAPGSRTGGRRPDGRRLRSATLVDTLRPRREPGLHCRLARRGRRP
jgi:4a-hydroxytetrahydrobiopterin dehydratase